MKNWLKAWWWIIVGAVLLCGSGIIPAIIPQAVPAANKTGNGTKFQLASGAYTSGHYLYYDVNGNAVDGGIPGGAAWGSITGSLPSQLDLEAALDSRVGDKRETNYYLNWQLPQPFKMTDFTIVTLSTGQNRPSSLWYLNGYLYMATDTTPGQLIKISADDLTVQTSVAFTADGFHDYASDSVYVPSTGKIYIVWGHLTETTISQIDPVTLAWTDVVHEGAQGTSGQTCGTGQCGQSLTSDGTYLYIATTFSPTVILKYKLSDWSKTTATLTARDYGHCIRYDGTYLWVTGNSSPAWVARVIPSTLTFISIPFATGDNAATDDLAFTDTDVWIGLEAGNGIIVRVNKAMSFADRISIGLASPIWGVFFDGQYIIALVNNTAWPMVRINPYTLETFRLQNSKPSGQTILSLMNEFAMDGAGRRWVTTYDSPGQVARLGAWASAGAGYSPHYSIANVTGGTWLDLDYTTGQLAHGGHQQYTGTAPSFSAVDTACGAGTTLDANASDTTGTFTLAGTPGTCVLTFNSTFTSVPHCDVALWEGGLLPLAYTPTATTLTITATGLTGDHITYRCTR
jgi:hypothetical protein